MSTIQYQKSLFTGWIEDIDCILNHHQRFGKENVNVQTRSRELQYRHILEKRGEGRNMSEQ
jgi:hypothetical protein